LPKVSHNFSVVVESIGIVRYYVKATNGGDMRQGNVFCTQIKRSRWLLFYLGFIHSVMLITLLSLTVPLMWSILGLVAMLLSFIHSCRRHQWLKSSIAVNYIKRDESGLWQLNYLNGKTQSALKLEHSFVSVNLVIIYLKGEAHWRSLSVVILSDAVDKSLFRELRVYLRDPKTFLQ
jgi:hypothetical protein